MIRRYQEGDHLQIGQIYYDAVHQIASKDYTPEQREAWASLPIGFDHWKKRCARKQPFVFDIEGEIAGFMELDPDGHIDCTYVSPKHARRGVMSALMNAAKEESRQNGVTKLFAEVSITARPFFEKHGFHVVRENLVDIRGVRLLNYIMHCGL